MAIQYTTEVQCNASAAVVTGGIGLTFDADTLRLINDGGNPGGPIYFSLASSAASTSNAVRLSTGETVFFQSPRTRVIGLYTTASSSGPMLRLAAWGGF